MDYLRRVGGGNQGSPRDQEEGCGGKYVQDILFMYMKFPNKENNCRKGIFSIWGRSLQVEKKVETRFVQVSKYFKSLITLK